MLDGSQPSAFSNEGVILTLDPTRQRKVTMSDPVRHHTQPLDLRVKVIAIAAVLAFLYVLVQYTSYAPFPHRGDSFVAGLAFGCAIAAAVSWVGRP